MKAAVEKGVEAEPHKVLKTLEYKMAWEALYERVFRVDIVTVRKSIGSLATGMLFSKQILYIFYIKRSFIDNIEKHEVKKQMMRMKEDLEGFMKKRIEYILNLNKTIEQSYEKTEQVQ